MGFVEGSSASVTPNHSTLTRDFEGQAVLYPFSLSFLVSPHPPRLPVFTVNFGIPILWLENARPLTINIRFAIENAFRFEDFTDDELLNILNLKLHSQDLEATDKAKVVAVEVLSRGRSRPNFGNGGEVENQLGLAKGRYQLRHSATKPSDRPSDIIFEPQDFDPEYDRAARASTNLDKLFEDVVGCENIIAKLSGYQQIAQGMKSKGLDPRGMVPTNFLFKGPPGRFCINTNTHGPNPAHRHWENYNGPKSGPSIL